jgi:O-antigen/teichoic acid export membrane protein
MSEIGRSVSRNVGILAIRQVSTWASTFILLLFLPRLLGPAAYGKFTLGQSLTDIFALFIDFGGQFWITKAVSRNHEHGAQIMMDAFALRVFLWVISFLCMNLYALIAGYDDITRMIIIIFSLALIWNSGTGVLIGVYQGFEEMRYLALSSIVATSFISGVGVFFLLHGVGPVGFTIIKTLGGLTSFLVCAFFIKRVVGKFPRVNWKNAIHQLRQGIPYLLNSIFGVIYYRIDVVMLSLLTPPVVVGWYGASYRFFDSLMFIPSIFTISIFPALSRMWGEKKMSIGRSVQKSLDFILILGIPISVGIFSFSEEIISIFYGLHGYQQSVLLLKIFAIGMLLVYVDIMLGTALLASDKQRQLSVLSFSAIIVNVGLNYALIPFTQIHFTNGGIGSAVATIITEFYIMLSMTMMLRKTVLLDCGITVQMKAILSGIIMAAFLWLAYLAGIHWIIRSIICAPIYMAAIFLLKTFEPSDIELMKGMLPKGVFLWKER